MSDYNDYMYEQEAEAQAEYEAYLSIEAEAEAERLQQEEYEQLQAAQPEQTVMKRRYLYIALTVCENCGSEYERSADIVTDLPLSSVMRIEIELTRDCACGWTAQGTAKLQGEVNGEWELVPISDGDERQ